MHHLRSSLMLAALALSLGVLPFVACEKKPAKSASGSAGHQHKPGESHDHDHNHSNRTATNSDDHAHGATTELGVQAVGGFTIKASRDGDLKGADAPINVWVSGGTAKVAAVRFWVGTQDAKGSVKAKAELEKDHWHTHAELPKPMPEGSKLWVEIETDKGEKVLASFDLKA